jgi:Cu+-exporting ATPase
MKKARDELSLFFDTVRVENSDFSASGGENSPSKSPKFGGLKSRWKISGMHCASCASRLENVLGGLEGVSGATVNFATSTATVDGLERGPLCEAVETAIKTAGFAGKFIAVEALESDVDKSFEHNQSAKRWVLAAVGFVPLSVLTMAEHFWPHATLFAPFPGRIWLEAVVSGAVVFGAASEILKAAWAALRRGVPDMDLLVGLGAVLAWCGTLANTLLNSGGAMGSYFEVAAGIVTFALFGRWLERGTREKAGAAIRALAQLQPGTVRVEVDGGVRSIDVREVAPGMIVQVAPGERIPVDGVLLEGTSSVDESWITGESLPVLRSPGAKVIGGTLNGDGALRVTVAAGGRDTFLQQVLRIVRDAQEKKPKVQKLADAVSAHFCLGVAIAAAVTTVIWALFGAEEARWSAAFWHGLSVLVVACPCALGLATPVAVLAGTGRAAQLGILFRNGAMLEILSEVNVVVFDKTGTLTFGRMRVVEWWERRSFDGKLLELVAAAQKRSLHPLAAAVVAAASERGLPIGEARDVTAVQGCGLKAEVAGLELLVGGAAWLESCGVILPEASASEKAERIWIATEGEFAGWFRVADEMRPEAREVVAELKQRGVTPVLLSGDQPEIAHAIAEQVGIEMVFAGVNPEGKRSRIRQLQESGVVAMVGDGVNDTPALAQANVGIAMGGGTAAARQTADITLIRDDLRSLLDAIVVSRKTLQVIRQNLALAFGYNILAIPLAAGLLEVWHGWSPGPMAASAAMALSSLSVVLNSVRLRSSGTLRGTRSS